jgi:hypothetical protein
LRDELIEELAAAEASIEMVENYPPIQEDDALQRDSELLISWKILEPSRGAGWQPNVT